MLLSVCNCIFFKYVYWHLCALQWSPALVIDYHYITAHREPATDLLCILLEQAQLETLIQLELADVPRLVEVLPGGVQLVQQLGDAWHQALGVRVAHSTAATAAATAAAIAIGERLAALNALEQSGNRFDVCINIKYFLLLLQSS